MMKKTLLSLCCILGFAAGARCAADKMPPDLDQLALHGIDSIQQLQFDAADKDFHEILARYPGQPYGYFGLALNQWGRLEYEKEESSKELDDLYEKMTDEAIDKSEAWLKVHPNDAYAHLCAGGVYGMRTRLAIMKHSWWRAYSTGKKAVKHMNQALALDPQMYDAYMGQGMYEYYTGTLPTVIRWLAKIIVISGDPKKGIEYIKIVKDKGHFLPTAAKLLLIEIYTQTDSKYADPKQALVWANELRQQYPDHPMLHFVQIVCLHESGKYDDVRTEALEYMHRIETGVPQYSQEYLPRALIALGTYYLAQKQLAPALENFKKAEPLSLDKPNRWAVWAVVREGNIYDLQGNRARALETYKRALKYPDTWGFKDYINAYVGKPYTWAQNPGQLPPP
jgi:tetratricopeptide (TPR) repeat protein